MEEARLPQAGAQGALAGRVRRSDPAPEAAGARSVRAPQNGLDSGASPRPGLSPPRPGAGFLGSTERGVWLPSPTDALRDQAAHCIALCLTPLGNPFYLPRK